MKSKHSCLTLSPCSNAKHFCMSKPPLVIFTVGLIVLAVAFVSLAMYVRDNDKIKDPNFNTNWSQFLTDLTDVEWSDNVTCYDTGKQPQLPHNLTYSVHIEVLVNMSKQFKMDDLDSYQAVVWKDQLLPKEKLPTRKSAVVMTFNHLVTPNTTTMAMVEVESSQSSNTLVPMCMTVSSTEPFLHKKLKKPKSCIPSTAETNVTKPLYKCSSKTNPSNFEIVHDEDITLRMYLTKNDRMNINLHLMSTSYFLFVVAATILVYGLIKRRSSNGSNADNTMHQHLINNV